MKETNGRNTKDCGSSYVNVIGHLVDIDKHRASKLHVRVRLVH